MAAQVRVPIHVHTLRHAGAVLACILAATACTDRPRPDARAAAVDMVPPYFGQPTPGTTPERFAPGIVSTDAVELNGVFTPDGREFFFTRLVDGIDTMFHSVVEGGRWTEPRPLLVYPGQVRAVAVDMSVSPDGQLLYFLGQHPHELAREKPGYDLWVSRRVNGEWATAQVVPPPVSTPADEYYPVVVADGSLYFTANHEDPRRYDAFRAQRHADGTFAAPVKVGPPINGSGDTGDTFVSPDERYAVFSSRVPGGAGNGDLYVTFRQDDGRWGPASSLGAGINTEQHEFCPMVTPDGKYLFFSRRWGATWKETTAGDVYWVDIKVLEQFRRRAVESGLTSEPLPGFFIVLRSRGSTPRSPRRLRAP